MQRQHRRTTRPSSVDSSLESDEDDDVPNQSLHVFFDIESMLGGSNIHVPIILVAEHEHATEPEVFKGEDCVEAFLTWLDTLAEEFKCVIVIAHNFRGYDGYPIVDAYHKCCQNIDQIRNGGKILTCNNITFVDSLSFFQMPLSLFQRLSDGPNWPRDISHTNLTRLPIRITWDPYHPWRSTCRRPSLPRPVKNWRRGMPKRWWRTTNSTPKET